MNKSGGRQPAVARHRRSSCVRTDEPVSARRGRARFDRGPGSHELQSRIAIDQRQSSAQQERRASARRGFAKPRLQRRPSIAGSVSTGPGCRATSAHDRIDQASASRWPREARSGEVIHVARSHVSSASVEPERRGQPAVVRNRACNGDRLSRVLRFSRMTDTAHGC
jgi:hypothetical protein